MVYAAPPTLESLLEDNVVAAAASDPVNIEVVTVLC